jgi:hypothetical protein
MDDEQFYEVEVDSFVIDAADFMATMLQRLHPDIDLTMELAKPWRPSWQIVVPDHYNINQIERAAYEFQKKLFWEHGVLIGYTVQQEGEDDDS